MISFSGYKRYITCPRMYYYHDIEKDRPGKKSTALIFGSIIDSVVNDILASKCPNPHAALADAIGAAQTEPVEFDYADFDADLVDLPALEKLARIQGWKGGDIVATVQSFLKAQDSLSDKQRLVMATACWNSLLVKGEAMIDSFIRWALPNIKEVHSVQQYLKQDGINGYLDFTCTWKDGRKILFDVKTSKMPYAPTAVTESAQLALYAAMTGYEYSGFIVLTKTLNKNKVKTCAPCGVKIDGGNSKKCPKCKTALNVVQTPTSYCQILIDKIPQVNKDLTKGAISDTIKAIEAKHFPRNVTNCFNHYGKHCVYVNKCWGKK
jgi:hypothetical protein